MSTLQSSKSSKFLLNLLLFLTFDLMLLGAGVRTMDAGLTCPDWPLCFGKAVPEYHFGVYLEFIHRVIAGIVGLLYMVFFFRVMSTKESKSLKIWSWVGLFFLLAQIIMGGLTVLKLLEAYIVTLHLSLATAFLLSLFIMKKRMLKDELPVLKLKTNKTAKIYQLNIILGIFFVIVQIVLGGLVASTYSGLVCIDFPTCNGVLFPKMIGPIAIQMYHRFGAYWLSLLMITLFSLSIFAFKKIGLNQKIRKQGVMIFFLIFTQIFVGVMNLKLMMPALLSVFHLALALTLLLTLMNLFYSVSIKVGAHAKS